MRAPGRQRRARPHPPLLLPRPPEGARATTRLHQSESSASKLRRRAICHGASARERGGGQPRHTPQGDVAARQAGGPQKKVGAVVGKRRGDDGREG